MNIKKALSAFSDLAAKAAKSGHPVGSVKIVRTGRVATAYAMRGADTAFHIEFDIDRSSNQQLLEHLFSRELRQASPIKTTTMGPLLTQKAVKLTRSADLALEVKSIQKESRTISGVATSGSPDRMNDVIEPLGVQASNPIPLLMGHDSKMPVGRAWLLPPTSKGVPFKATIADPKTPGILQDRCTEAWESLRHGLIPGVSIGFRDLGGSEVLRSGGRRYTSVEVMELSLCTIPCQPDAVILSVEEVAKEAERQFRVALSDAFEDTTGDKDAQAIQAALLEELSKIGQPEPVQEPVKKKAHRGPVRFAPRDYHW